MEPLDGDIRVVPYDIVSRTALSQLA
jgi:hypothetical protein